eukprot:982547-Pelagomonas_calceolata.AAC.2
MGLRLSAIWAVMVAFKQPVNAGFEGKLNASGSRSTCNNWESSKPPVEGKKREDCTSKKAAAADQPLELPVCNSAGAFIQGNEVLSWAGNNTKKMGLQQGATECCRCCLNWYCLAMLSHTKETGLQQGASESC